MVQILAMEGFVVCRFFAAVNCAQLCCQYIETRQLYLLATISSHEQSGPTNIADGLASIQPHQRSVGVVTHRETMARLR